MSFIKVNGVNIRWPYRLQLVHSNRNNEKVI